jgi:capsular exopolysaccharide synthesis family protein
MNRTYTKALPNARGEIFQAVPQGNGRYDATPPGQRWDAPQDMGGGNLSGGGGPTNPNLFKLVHRLLRGRYVLTFSLAGAFALIGAIAGFTSTRPMYRTTGTVRVQSQMGGLGSYSGNSLAFLATQAALMRNDRVLQIAVENAEWKAIGMGTDAQSQEDLADSLDISQVPGSTELIYITSTHRESKFTKAAVKSILWAFIQFQQTDQDRLTDATTAAYQARKNDTERAIRESGAQILELSKEFGTTDLKSAIDQKSMQINEVEAQINALDMRLAEIPVETPSPGTVPLTPKPTEKKWSPLEISKVDATMKQYLETEADLAARYESLRQRYTDQHNAVRRASDDLATIRIKIERYASQWKADPAIEEQVQVLSSGDRPAIERVRANKAGVRDNLFAERNRMSLTQQRIDALKEQIRRDEGRLTEIQSNIDEQTMRLQIMNQTNPTRMQIVSEGFTPAGPSVDRRKQFAAAGFVLGGGMPVAIMLLLGLMDRRFRYSDDASDTGINAPLLGILPILPPDVHDEERRAMAAHCVHNIRVLLQLSGEVGGAKVFAVTSPTAGDGKTSLVLSLGLSFAASGSRTCLVDFDTVGTGLSASLDVRGGLGVLDAIRNNDAGPCIRQTSVDPNLFIIPSSRGDDVHVSRVSTSSVRRLLEQLRNQFDAVIIDTGPILGSIEASLAAAQADGVILVIGRGQHHTYVKRAVDRITAVGGRLAGMVFNRASAADFRRSVSAASMRSIPRGLPAGPSGHASQRNNVGPMASSVRGFDPDDRRAAS